MGTKIKNNDKFLLNNGQIDALYKSHQKVIREGLIQMGIPRTDHNAFLDAAAITFETLIEETQVVLTAAKEKDELRREILKN